MTLMKDSSRFLGLNRLYFMTSEGKFVNGGIFDSNYGRLSETYVAGELFDPEIDFFNDKIYHNRDAMVLSWDHYIRKVFGRRIRPHLHDKWIVSTNPDISINDIFQVTSAKDIIIFGDPIKETPPHYEDGTLQLWEVEPHLSPTEIKNLYSKIDSLSLMQNRLIIAEKKESQAHSESFLSITRAISAESSNITLATNFEALLQRFQSLHEKMISIQVKVFDKSQNALENIEDNLDLNIPGNTMDQNQVNTTIREIQSDITMLESLKGMGLQHVDNVKEHAFQLSLKICGLDYIRKKVCSDEDTQTLPQDLNSSMSNLTMQQLKSSSLAGETPEQTAFKLNSTMNAIKQEFSNNGGNIDAAIATITTNLNSR